MYGGRYQKSLPTPEKVSADPGDLAQEIANCSPTSSKLCWRVGGQRQRQRVKGSLDSGLDSSLDSGLDSGLGSDSDSDGDGDGDGDGDSDGDSGLNSDSGRAVIAGFRGYASCVLAPHQL